MEWQSYTPATYLQNKFHCPYCNVFAHQRWFLSSELFEELNYTGGTLHQNNIQFSNCQHCDKFSIWLDDRLLFPIKSTLPKPHDNMPENVKAIYNEARSIHPFSPRAAAALLRLCTEILVNGLEPEGHDLNAKIGTMVKKGLAETIQQALDSLRVVGNEQVHPGQIDLEEDEQTAIDLFQVLNYVVQNQIKDKADIKRIYKEIVPEDKKKGIEQRDK